MKARRLLLAAVAGWLLPPGALALEVEFVSHHPSSTLRVAWLGPDQSVVFMGDIEPLQSLQMQDVGEVWFKG